MGSFLEIGTKAGQAAPGEYSPSALAITRGDIIYVDSTGKPVRLPLGSSGLALMSNGTDLLYRQPPGYQLLDDDGRTYDAVAGSGAEGSLMSTGAAIASIFPAYAAKGDAVEVLANVTWVNNPTSGNQTCALNLYLGGTKVFGVTSPALGGNATARSADLALRVVYRSSTQVKILTLGTQGNFTGPGTGTQAIAAAGDAFIADAAGVTVSAMTAASSLELKAQASVNGGTSTVTLGLLQARYFPKNY